MLVHNEYSFNSFPHAKFIILFPVKIIIIPGLEIISGESPDTMTAQIHFSSVTYSFWPVKLYKMNNS